MSASEKLKRLEVTGAFVEHGFMPPETAEKLKRIHEALPQIVAVVEAAENQWRGNKDDEAALDAAIAALDEALTKTVLTGEEKKA